MGDINERINGLFEAFGLDITEARVEPFGEGHWAFSAGSAEVEIVVETTEEGEAFLEARSPIIELAGDVGPLFEHVLELNATLVGGAFSVSSGMLEIRANRRASELDDASLKRLVLDVAGLADHYDDVLAEQFGLRREADL